MVELGGLGRRIHDQVSQACTPGELADVHGHKLAPPVEGSKVLTVMVLLCHCVKFMFGKKCNDLPEDCVMVGHWLGSPFMVRFSAKTL